MNTKHILLALFFLFSCLFVISACSNEKTHMDSDIYLKLNFNPIEHTDGMTPKRLENLKGNIEILSVFEYSANEDSSKGPMTQGTATFSLVFDKDKRIIEEWGYRDTKQVSSKSFYSDFWSRKKDRFLVYNREGEESVRESYQYNEDGILISESREDNGEKKEWLFDLMHDGDVSLQKTKWGNNKYLNNKLVERRQNNDSLISTYEYYSDAALKSIAHMNKGKLSYIEEFSPQGRLVFLQHNVYEDSQLVGKRIRKVKYDQNQRKIETSEITERNSDSDQLIRTYEYQMDRLSKVYEDVRVIGEFKYNEEGDLVEKVYDGDKETNEYIKYDSTGNWLLKNTYYNDKLFSITEREFQYHKN